MICCNATDDAFVFPSIPTEYKIFEQKIKLFTLRFNKNNTFKFTVILTESSNDNEKKCL